MIWLRRGVAFHKYYNGAILLDVKGRVFMNLNFGAAEVIERSLNGERIDDIARGLAESMKVPEEVVIKEINNLFKVLETNKFITKDVTEAANISPFQRQPELASVTIRITNKCNLRCKHCYLGEPDNEEISFDVIEQLLQSLHSYRVLALSITGGEPLLYSKIIDVLKIADKYCIPFRISTNGCFLTPKVMDELKAFSYLHTIVLSLEGDKRVHDFIRGDGNFERTINLMQVLRQYGIPFSVNITVNSFNFNRIDDLVGFCLNEGAYTVHLTLMHPEGRAKDSDLCLSGDDIETTIQQIILVRKKHKRVLLGSAEYGFLSSILNMEDGFGVCNLGKGWCEIESDGAVVPCRRFYTVGKVAGNIYYKNFEEVWKNGALFKELRHLNYYEIKDCRGCRILTYCRGGCRIRAYERTGNFLGSENESICVLRRKFFPELLIGC